MKSTGEVMGVGRDYHTALHKALIATGLTLPAGGNVLIVTGERDETDCVKIAKRFVALGFKLIAAEDACRCLEDAGITAGRVSGEAILDLIKTDKVELVISTPAKEGIAGRLGFTIRRTAMEYNIPCVTSLDTMNAILEVLEHTDGNSDMEIYPLDEYSVRSGIH